MERFKALRARFRPTAIQTIALGFALIILTGALLLMLPVCSRDGSSLAFFDALFTSVSATCVTGLVVVDTWTQFTFLGQLIVLLLIQLGGLGFMTVMVLLLFALKRRIGLRERELLSESISLDRVGGVVKLIRRVLIGTAVFELSGAALFAIRFIPVFGFFTGVWYSIFHAVSAFCNAGFDLMGCFAPYASLTVYRDDVLVNLTAIALIITGGIGFSVWSDLWDCRLRLRKCCLHTKIMLAVSGILIVVPFFLFLCCEKDASMAGMTLPQRMLASLFQSVTPRTAGMNTIDLAQLSGAGTVLTTVLMFIGAGPGSTGGGVKVTTVTVVILAIAAYMRGGEDMNIFRRRLDGSLTRRAALTTAFYFLLALSGVLVIELLQDLPLSEVILEVFSALGTVGLSTGLTRVLNPLSRLVIILLMYSGRVGSLTVLLSVSEHKSHKQLRNPMEKIIIS